MESESRVGSESVFRTLAVRGDQCQQISLLANFRIIMDRELGENPESNAKKMSSGGNGRLLPEGATATTPFWWALAVAGFEPSVIWGGETVCVPAAARKHNNENNHRLQLQTRTGMTCPIFKCVY